MKSRRRYGCVRCGLLVVLSLVLMACATPVGVTRVDTLTAHHLLTASALTSQTPSAATGQVLHRLGLYEQFQAEPAAVLAMLHAGLAPAGDEHRLFALAELSFLHAEQSRQDRAAPRRRCKHRGCTTLSQQPRVTQEETQEYYLAAAIYAYALLFPTDRATSVLGLADPRARLSYDLYNRGLAEGLASPDGQEVALTPGRRKLPFGTLALTVELGDRSGTGCQLEHFVPAAKLAVRGLRNRYRVPGIGAPLAASLACTTPTMGSGVNRFPPRLKVPVTLFLRLTEPRRGLTRGPLRWCFRTVGVIASRHCLQCSPPIWYIA